MKITAVIPTFNSVKFIGACLESVFAQDYRDLEVIVVDNGSQDETVAVIQKRFPGVRLIRNQGNLGACKARNQGIEHSSGEWILALDCDVVLKKGFLSLLAEEALHFSKDIGMIQPKVLCNDGKTIYTSGIFLSAWRRFYDLGQGKIDSEEYQKPGYLFGASSAAAFLRKKMLEALREEYGYFDERFFFLVEDVDLSWRAQRNGWKTLFLPQLICYHLGNSCGFEKKLRQYLCFRNRAYLIGKNEGFLSYTKKILPLCCYDLPRWVYLRLTNPYFYKKQAAAWLGHKCRSKH